MSCKYIYKSSNLSGEGYYKKALQTLYGQKGCILTLEHREEEKNASKRPWLDWNQWSAYHGQLPGAVDKIHPLGKLPYPGALLSLYKKTIDIITTRLLIFRRYSVMQSDGNGFDGDVVSDSFNKASRDEDNLLDKIYNSKYIRLIIMMILIIYNIIRKCILTLQQHENPILWVPSCYMLFFFKFAYSSITLKL